MALLPNAGPPLPKTHQPIAMDVIVRLRDALQAHLGGQRASLAAAEAVAAAEGVPLSHAYAALASDPSFVVDVSESTLIAICVGSCQEQGAIPTLERLLEAKKAREAAGVASFDIIPRSCLDMCAHSPVCLSRSPQGQAAHPRLRPEAVEQIVSTLCDAG